MFEMIKSLMTCNTLTVVKNEEGQGMVEYGLLVALISIAAIAAIVLIGPQLLAAFQSVADNL